MDDLQDEWQDLLQFKGSLQNLNQSPTSFWQELLQVKDGNNKPRFPNLALFMRDLLALPHSSAAVERIFSKINIIKTKHSNTLLSNTVANRVLAKQAIARQGVSCYDWKPSRILLSDLKTGKCHQRYKDMCSKVEMATLHPPDSDDGNSDEELPLQVYIH